MPCPRCGSSHITEEYKLVECVDCGYILDDSRLQAEGPVLQDPVRELGLYEPLVDGEETGRPRE